jgi:hypothetical protein
MAHRLTVSPGLVIKLRQPGWRTGEIALRHRFSGHKTTIVAARRKQRRFAGAELPALHPVCLEVVRTWSPGS